MHYVVKWHVKYCVVRRNKVGRFGGRSVFVSIIEGVGVHVNVAVQLRPVRGCGVEVPACPC